MTDINRHRGLAIASLILGGISFVLTKQLNMFLYICLLTSLFQCIFELIKNNA